jgi:tetratricopeptide (TPR) repeat protein
VRDVRVDSLGVAHPDTLVSLNNLASGYFGAGRIAEAAEMFEQACDAIVRSLGSGHPHAQVARNNLAAAYMQMGQLERAIELLRPAAEGMEKLNFRHEQAGLIVGNLISCAEQLNQLAEAENWRRKWLALVKAGAGAEHPAYAGELATLGLNLLAQDKPIEAEQVLRECLAIREKLASVGNPAVLPWQVANTTSMLGDALARQKQFDDAEPLLLAGYEKLKEHAAEIPPQAKFAY